MSHPLLSSLCLWLTVQVICSLGQPGGQPGVQPGSQPGGQPGGQPGSPTGGQDIVQVLQDMARLKQELATINASLSTQVEASQEKDEEMDLVKAQLKNIQQENQALKEQLQNIQKDVTALASTNTTLSTQEDEEVHLVKAQMQLLQAQMQNITQEVVGGGVVYIRYGRTTCPYRSQLVYTGYIGGSHYSSSGGGSEYLCLPKDPEWLNTKAGNHHHAYMHGTEFETGDSYMEGLFDKRNLHNHDALCSVCHVKSRNVKIMIPGKYTCPDDTWTKEYYGYLMTEKHTHNNNKDYVCVDRNPDVRVGGSADYNGALLYFVEAVCGSLPCPPYVGGWEFSCVVCTR